MEIITIGKKDWWHIIDDRWKGSEKINLNLQCKSKLMEHNFQNMVYNQKQNQTVQKRS